MRLAICDVGLGNLRSVERALVHAGSAIASVSVVVTHDADVVRRADKIVVPGQGGFGACAAALGGGLGEAVRGSIARGAPYLGLCLGLQILFGESEEAPGAAGLGIFEGDVARLKGGVDAQTGAPLKVPHMGWNVAAPNAENRALFSAAPEHFYFVHSYVVRPKDERLVASTTEYGVPFVSAIAKDNVFACQFHPEKSQAAGLALLRRFLEA